MVLVTLPEWFVADGQVSAPAVGDVMAHVGVRAACFDVRSTDEARAEPCLLPKEGGQRENAHRLPGVVAGTPREVVVDAPGGGRKTVAVEFPFDLGGFRVLVTAPTSAQDVRPGDRLAVSCTLCVIAEYEWEAFNLPDVRRDWRVISVVSACQPADSDYLLDLLPFDTA